MVRSYIGDRVKRLDGIDKVTGQAQFVDDIMIKACSVKVVRSTCAHGIIKNIYTVEAAALPGVIQVITGQVHGEKSDVCRPGQIGICLADQHPLAMDKVRYYGEPVACVVAVNTEIARKAASLVRVEYEELSPLLDPETAFHERHNLIHTELGSYKHLDGFYPAPGTNIFHHFKIVRGDVDAVMAGADLFLEINLSSP